MLLDWVYTGKLPNQDVFMSKVFDVIEVASFLLIDIVIEPCTKMLAKVKPPLYFQSRFSNELVKIIVVLELSNLDIKIFKIFRFKAGQISALNVVA